MNSYKTAVHHVLVDIPKYDNEGNIIPLDFLSSGGARNPDGSFIAQYRNPRLAEPSNNPKVEGEFLNREDNARRWRDEAAKERRRRETEDFIRDLAIIVIDRAATPLMEKVIIPRAVELWEAKVLPESKRLWENKVQPGGKRLAQRFLRPKTGQADIQEGNGDASGVETAFAVSDSSEISIVQEGFENSPLADVIQMDGYHNRRSA